MIYHSLRIGKNGQPFYLLKIKTMKEHGGVPTASKNDTRLTKFGKLLRRFKLDEIPTIINLIKGDIILCSYRPDTPDEIASLDEKTRKLLYKFKPGIISPATIWNQYEDTTLADKLDPHEYYTKVIKPIKYYLNTYYLKRKNLWYDIRIILAYIFKKLGVNPRRFNIYPPNFGKMNE